jgi:hypothetical protein
MTVAASVEIQCLDRFVQERSAVQIPNVPIRIFDREQQLAAPGKRTSGAAGEHGSTVVGDPDASRCLLVAAEIHDGNLGALSQTARDSVKTGAVPRRTRSRAGVRVVPRRPEGGDPEVPRFNVIGHDQYSACVAHPAHLPLIGGVRSDDWNSRGRAGSSNGRMARGGRDLRPPVDPSAARPHRQGTEARSGTFRRRARLPLGGVSVVPLRRRATGT